MSNTVNNEKSNEFVLRDELRERRSNIKTFDDLVAFLKYIENDCNCGYGEAPRAMAQASAAVAWYLADKFGITGFQAGFVMWDFIRDWMYRSNECGMKITDYDNMLYPQYDYKFDKTISPTIWANLQETAKKRLEERDNVHPTVKAHWQSIVDGVVPFGYKVSDER